MGGTGMQILNHLTGFPAVLTALTAAVMWGSWFVSLKYLKKYPIEAFYMVMFSFCLVFVWGVSFLLAGKDILDNIAQIWRLYPAKILCTLLGGMLYAAGLWVSLKIMERVGLALSQPLLQSLTLIAGTCVSLYLGGRPETLTDLKIVLTVLFLLGAAVLVYFADQKRAQSNSGQKEAQPSAAPLKTVVGLTVVAALLTVSYDAAMAYGLETITQTVGLKVLPFMCLLCTGAFFGVLFTCGAVLTKKHQWAEIKKAPFSIHKWSILSGFCHYGGNIIHSFATRGLSAVVSYPLGLTSGLWTQLWGLKYGEFKGAPVSAYVCLFASFACYAAAALCISL